MRQLWAALDLVSTLTQEGGPAHHMSRDPVIFSAIIPCLDEEIAIPKVVAAVLAQGVNEVIVADGASRDQTAARAAAAGARVVVEPRRGDRGSGSNPSRPPTMNT